MVYIIISFAQVKGILNDPHDTDAETKVGEENQLAIQT